MAQQLLLLDVKKRSPRRRRPASGGTVPAASEWRLDERTIAIGRRGLQDARRALRAGSAQAA